MSSLPCDVVILPSPLLAEQSISASNKLSKLGSLITLEDGKCYPHISIYMLQLNTGGFDNVEQLLKKIARAYSPLQLRAQRYDQTMGYIDADYKKIPELIGLQAEVIKAMNPVRDGMRAKDKARMQEATGLARKNYEEYGWQSVGDLFRPHLTLGRLKSNDASALELLGGSSQFDGAFLKLGLFETGDNGTAIRKIFEFDFLGSSPSH